MIARAVVVTVIPAVIAAGVGVETAAAMADQATGPGVIFATDAVWQWGLLVVAAGIVFRAGQIVKNIDAIEEARTTAAATQAEINSRIIRRLEDLERWRRDTDHIVVEWQTRSGMGRRREDGGGS